MSVQPVGVAVVGAGYWGPNLIRNFLNCGDTELLAVVDLQVERAARVIGRRSEVRVTDLLDDVLSDPDIEAVAVATPPESHLEVGLACLEAGKHLLMEKPLATSSDDGAKLVAAAERYNRVLMCDHTFCYTPAVKAIREYVRSGSIGSIQYVESVRVNLGLVQSNVDVFWDLAPHDLSILDFVLPESCRPVAVGAYGADPIGAGQTCVGYLTLPLANGGIAHITVSWLSPSKIRQTIVSGSKRMILWDDMKPYQRLALFDCGVEVGPPAIEDEKRKLMVSYRKGDMVSPALVETEEALHDVVLEFARSIREGRAPLTNGQSGLRVLKVLEGATRSMAARGALVSLEEL